MEGAKPAAGEKVAAWRFAGGAVVAFGVAPMSAPPEVSPALVLRIWGSKFTAWGLRVSNFKA